MKGWTLLILLFLIVPAGCESPDEQQSYQENKKMVVDMLKTDDGKRAVREMLQEKEMKGAVVLDQSAVKETIVETMTTDQGKELWQELMKDSDFSKQLAKAMQKENEALLKKLMKDPSYQEMMMDILKAPDLQQEYLDLMKTKQFREQMEQNVQDLMGSPFFEEKMANAIGEALKKQKEAEKK
ncbi:spore gernimation protein GerD [Sporolactobacillus sp. THM7-7]|nr:spore gernimation protein GerD [Sporolactobacillus sp. THM7-7]